MSDDTHDKHRKPDAYIQLEIKGNNGKTTLTDVGGVWNGKNGYQTGSSIWGRVVIQPGEQRERLQKIRQEKAQSPSQGHSQEP